jgi:hypothetical protein
MMQPRSAIPAVAAQREVKKRRLNLAAAGNRICAATPIRFIGY